MPCAAQVEPVVEFLDAVLDLAAPAVDLLVDPFRVTLEVGDDEARVVAGLASRVVDHLGLEDDPAHAVPGSGRVGELGVEPLTLAGELGELAHRRDLAEELRKDRPGLKVVFMSGYSAEVVGKETEFFRRARSHFLQKPCSPATLLQTIRQCLDEN